MNKHVYNIFENLVTKSMFQKKPKLFTKSLVMKKFFGLFERKEYVIKIFEEIYPIGMVYGIQEAWYQIYSDYDGPIPETIRKIMYNTSILIAEKNPFYKMTIDYDIYNQIFKHGLFISKDGLNDKYGNYVNIDSCATALNNTIDVTITTVYNVGYKLYKKLKINYDDKRYIDVFVNEFLKAFK
jgi:hypothetical protein